MVVVSLHNASFKQLMLSPPLQAAAYYGRISFISAGEPWFWGLLLLSGARIKRELVLQTAEERHGIEFPSVLLGDPVYICSIFMSYTSSLGFLIQSNWLILSWVIAENHRCATRRLKNMVQCWLKALIALNYFMGHDECLKELCYDPWAAAASRKITFVGYIKREGKK